VAESISGVMDFKVGTGKDGRRHSLRVALDAAGFDLPKDLKNVNIVDAAGMIASIDADLRSRRPGMRMEFKFGRGHVKILSASHAAVVRDIGPDPMISSLEAAIIERYRSRATGAERSSCEEGKEVSNRPSGGDAGGTQGVPESLLGGRPQLERVDEEDTAQGDIDKLAEEGGF
jgi:hypothetical protein